MAAYSSRFFALNTEKPLSYDVCGQLISKDGFLHHRRTFEQNVFLLVLEGTLYITANNTEFTLSPHQFIFLRADEEHFGHLTSSGRLSYLWVHLRGDKPFDVLDTVPGASALNTSYPYCFPEYGEILSTSRVIPLFRQLLNLSLEEKLPAASMLDYALSMLLLELTREHLYTRKYSTPDVPQTVLAVCEWIRSNYYRQFTVSELAARFGYQADYLSTLFKKHMGISLIAYTNRLRIEASKNLLANYALSIKEAAYSCGFPDEKYYMKVFKRLEGITPSQYKNTL